LICIDASVAGKWLFAEEHTAQADELLRVGLERRDPIVAPPLLHAEVTNVVRQRMRRDQLELAEARALLEQFLELPISLRAPRRLHDRALVVSHQYNLPAIYDAYYVALAELLGATLWTADQRLLRALGGASPFVRCVAEYAA
jgi:predicted nucleic acid-binding protein